MSNKLFEKIVGRCQIDSMTTKQKPGYPLRMPDQLREDLERAASQNGRSLHAEILHRLEEYSWIAAESAERRQIADHLMREKVDLLEELSDKSTELHKVTTENIRLREALDGSGYPPEEMVGLEYKRVKEELRNELLAELVDVARQSAEEALEGLRAERG